MRARIEITQADITDLHPEIPASAHLVDVEAATKANAVIVTMEW